ncbi:MAG: hypothetical protein M3495_00275 [Pseudomonadota bacterium]|nr:hypothetical protein [Pseudomonadota bacterium]
MFYDSGPGQLRRFKEMSAAPPRLLIAVHNGRGGHVAIGYASMHDKAVVEQHPELTWFDGRPKASPHEQWVAKSIAVTDDFQTGVTSTTSYVYKNPRFAKDDEGHYGFRGFDQVTGTSPSGAQTIQRYGYNIDWSGRLTATLVVPAEAPSEVRSIDKTTWEGRDLFGGAIKTYHAITTEHLTCANGKTEQTCTAIPAAYTRTTATLTALASTTVASGPSLLWQPTASLLQAGTSAAEGDRQTLSTFALAADGSTYRLRPLTQTKQSRVGGVMTMFAKSQQTWDASYLVPLTSEVWFDTIDANRAITRSVYDAFGNVTERWKPVQNAANTVKTTFAYDSRKLFLATETNELGHVLDYTWEYGTGTKLSTSGPNTAGCFPNCTVDALHPPKQLHKIKTDGLGRELEHWETASSDGYVFTLSKFGDARYVDTAVGGIPASSTTRRMFAASGADYIQEKIELDGHGRPIKKILFAQGSAPSDQATVFHYRADGTLRDVQVPDPTQNNASLVTYTYTFDSLGRATSIRRPDATTPVDQSGVDITYDGVEQTTTEYVGATGGNRARTKTRSDSFGRLIRVDERIAASPDSFATTVYTYSPDDNVKTIVDPQNVTTQLVHDFAGRRTQITRTGGRTWTYSYDKNGNMTSERVPGSPNPPLTDPLYTTTIVYDALDRPVSKRNAPRGLSVADQALFASDHETYTWDYGPNHKGYLRYWRSYAPGATSPAILYNVFNDAQGLRTKTEHQLTIAGYPLILRATHESHLLFGGLLTTRYYDSFGGNNATDSEVAYDKRGMPKWITLRRDGMPTLSVAAQTRDVAGLVTNRRTNTTGAMTFVESNWTYDKLGRVTRQLVQKGPGPTQIAHQQLTYLGNDDPSTLTHTLGTSAKQFQFGYDQRHQLVSANETSTTGYFSSTYGYGSAGRFAAATLSQNSPPVGSELKPRDVTYQYTGTDPEQVTALINASGANAGLPFASYTYDKAGNQTSRCFGTPTTPTCAGESIAYVYDGKDQLRRATKKLNGVVQGSEEYWYDVDGNRIAVVKRDKLGNKTELISFIRDVEAHYDGAGAITHVYSHLSLGTPVARVDRTSNTSAPVEFQFHGLASNTIAAVSDTGTINASFSYAPFGEVIEATNSGGASVGTAAHMRRMNDKFGRSFRARILRSEVLRQDSCRMDTGGSTVSFCA